jgi:hypothetical protein
MNVKFSYVLWYSHMLIIPKHLNRDNKKEMALHLWYQYVLSVKTIKSFFNNLFYEFEKCKQYEIDELYQNNNNKTLMLYNKFLGSSIQGSWVMTQMKLLAKPKQGLLERNKYDSH